MVQWASIRSLLRTEYFFFFFFTEYAEAAYFSQIKVSEFGPCTSREKANRIEARLVCFSPKIKHESGD